MLPRAVPDAAEEPAEQPFVLHGGDCMAWLAQRPACSIEAIVTDPPYGLREYSDEEQHKLRAGYGGVWRIPPSFNGSLRSPLPRARKRSEHRRTRGAS